MFNIFGIRRLGALHCLPVILIFLGLLVACSNVENGQKNNTYDNSVQVKTNPKEIEKENREKAKIEINIESKSFSNRISNWVAESGKIYVVLNLSFQNTGDIPIIVTSGSFRISASDGYTVESDVATYALNDSLQGVTLDPGQKASGSVVFKAPKDTQYTLTFDGVDVKLKKDFSMETD